MDGTFERERLSVSRRNIKKIKNEKKFKIYVYP